jgi:hypothetical protein
MSAPSGLTPDDMRRFMVQHKRAYDAILSEWGIPDGDECLLPTNLRSYAASHLHFYHAFKGELSRSSDPTP